MASKNEVHYSGTANPGNEGPFKATLLWKKLINNLKANVVSKSFSGKSVVDVVYACLLTEHNSGHSSLITKQVTRSSAIKVCQALLDSNVIYPFTPIKHQTDLAKRNIFSEDDAIYYKFKDDEDCIFKSPAPLKSKQNSKENHLGLFSPIKSSSPFSKLKKNNIEIIDQKQPCLVRCKKISLSDINMNNLEKPREILDLEFIQREIAFRHLLRLMELPFLEQLIPHQEIDAQKFEFDKNLLEESIFSSPQMWTLMVKGLTGSSCAYYDNLVGLSDDQIKRQEYLKLRHHYRDHPLVLVPTSCNEIFVIILDMIKHKKYSQALLATQLTVLLLPQSCRKNLQLLLNFMDLVAKDTVQLEDDIGNSHLVLNHFSPNVFNFKLLEFSKTIILTKFLLFNRNFVFTIPNVIKQEMMDRKLQQKTMPQEFQYCDKVPENLYQDYIRSESNASLEQLLETVMDSTKMSLNEKRKHLKRFKKFHPEIYEKCMK